MRLVDKSLLCSMKLESRKYQIIERVMQFDEEELAKLEIFLSEEQGLSESLERSLHQVRDGKVMPHEQVKKKYEKWL
jgi:hypothetical protein